MAGKGSSLAGRGVLRTYGRLHPIRRLQQKQAWLSPAVTDRHHLFSSSASSSSHLSSSNDDSDFLPAKRRKKVECKKKLKPPEKPAVCRKRRKKKSQPESRSQSSHKENDALPARSGSPILISTPCGKFVTLRRKAPGVVMKPLSGKPKRTELTSSDFHDSEVKRRRRRRRRKLCTEVISILDSSMDTLSSPLQKAPLLSSTPSVLLTAMPRTDKSFVRQLALCEPLEDSVVICCSQINDGGEEAAMLSGDVTTRMTQLDCAPQSCDNRQDERQEGEQCSRADNQDMMDTSELQCPISTTSSNAPRSGVQSLSIRVPPRGSPLCILSPVSVRSSKSLICLDRNKTAMHNLEDSQAFCASPELFSAEDSPHLSPQYGAGKAVRGRLVGGTVDGSSSLRIKAGMLDGSLSGRVKFGMLVGSSPGRVKVGMLDGSSSGRIKAGTVNGRVKFGMLVGSSPGRVKAGTLDGSSSGRVKAGMLDGCSSGRIKAGMLVGSSPGRIKAGMLVGSSPGRIKAGTLVGSSPGRVKAGMLDGCSSGRIKAGTVNGTLAGTLDGSSPGRFLKGVPADPWKCIKRKSLQPVVKLYSDAVSEYLRDQSWADPVTCPPNISLSMQDLQRMQPVVQLDPHCVTKYFKDKNLWKTQSVDPAPHTNLTSPTLQMGLRTPLVTLSVPKGNVHNSATLQETTGRKVCISGFSVKRWGNRRKKSSKAQQQLSFMDCGDTSVFPCKENMSLCGALSPLHLSPSLLTSSFLNSSAVKNLDLSTESLSMRDPQKDHQRWARLRAALTLHRKKKVEAGLPSIRLADRKSAHGNCSSLLLLSPFQSSLCCDDLTDAEKVLAECQQEKPITFQQCLTQDQLRQCQKVGEGVYGEVFRTLRGEELVALKIIPIEGSQKVNGEHQKSFAEILPEIIISKELSLLSGGEENKTSGFIKLHSAYCVQGCYPLELLAAWDEFAEEKGSENERPDLFGEEQLFMILEFEFGGDDLERMSSKLPSVMASRSILHQVTTALAVAEEELRFEHRDLHWGNLLIENCSNRTILASLKGKIFHIPTAGVQVKIIDYTLSRLDKDGLTVFCDLSTDEDLYLGEGDLQFDVYRGMREENRNSWSLYRPHSNVLWLHYLCDKLLSEVKYVRKPTSASYQKELRKLRDFRREVRQFSSAMDILQRSKLFN